MSNILCSVCGDMATSYLHYGARVCHSCRTFFRRTSVMLVRGKMKRSFFCCLRGGNCTVDLHTRKKCNYCRFEKCKAEGMLPDRKENGKVSGKYPETSLNQLMVVNEGENMIGGDNLKVNVITESLEEAKKVNKTVVGEAGPIGNNPDSALVSNNPNLGRVMQVSVITKVSDITKEVDEEDINVDEVEPNSHNSDSGLVCVNHDLGRVQNIPHTLSYRIGATEFRRLHFFVELWHMQKVVQPVGLPNIIPVLQSLQDKTHFPPAVLRNQNTLREHWWAQFCNGLEEFQVLSPAEKKIVLKNAPLANRLCRGLYFGPGAVKNLLSIVKGMTRDKAEMMVVENFLSLNKIDQSEPLEIGAWAWRSSPVSLSSENKEILLSLDKEIVTWGQKGVDDVSELLACLLILFSQEAGDSFSNRIGQIFEGWRFILWRYLESLLLPWETRVGLFHGALGMVGIARKIWNIEHFCFTEWAI